MFIEMKFIHCHYCVLFGIVYAHINILVMRISQIYIMMNYD